MNAFEKFKSLKHCNADFEPVDDWGFTPSLYHFDSDWVVDWIGCDDGDSLKAFNAETPEAAIDKAYNWSSKHNLIKK